MVFWKTFHYGNLDLIPGTSKSRFLHALPKVNYQLKSKAQSGLFKSEPLGIHNEKLTNSKSLQKALSFDSKLLTSKRSVNGQIYFFGNSCFLSSLTSFIRFVKMFLVLSLRETKRKPVDLLCFILFQPSIELVSNCFSFSHNQRAGFWSLDSSSLFKRLTIIPILFFTTLHSFFWTIFKRKNTLRLQRKKHSTSNDDLPILQLVALALVLSNWH